MQNNHSIEDRISVILSEFSQTPTQELPYNASLLLRDALGLESLALVSVILRIGDEFGVDVTDSAMELNALNTVNDLYVLAHKLQKS